MTGVQTCALPIWELVDTDQSVINRAGPGVSANVYRAVGRRITLGVYARVQGLRSVVRDGELATLAERPFTMTTLAVEGAWHGGPGKIAPVGLHWTLGLGYNLIAAGDYSGPSATERFGDAIDIEEHRDIDDPDGTVSVTFGAGYNYIYRDQFVLTPFVRAEFGTFGLPMPLELPIGAFFQTGVKLGGLF